MLSISPTLSPARATASSGSASWIDAVWSAETFFQAVPPGDGYIISNVLRDWDDPAQADAGRQADCFRNVAQVLAPGGAFVLEAFVPDPADFDRDEQLQVRAVTEDSVRLRVHRYDRSAQTFIRQSITLSEQGVRLEPFAMRYCWPEQMDEMAHRAGLQLAERYADWGRQPFDAGSKTHISVYRAR